jgi:hypothetical protein
LAKRTYIHVRIRGDVEVQGHVAAGARIFARGNITIGGRLDGGRLRAGGRLRVGTGSATRVVEGGEAFAVGGVVLRGDVGPSETASAAIGHLDGTNFALTLYPATVVGGPALPPSRRRPYRSRRRPVHSVTHYPRNRR